MRYFLSKIASFVITLFFIITLTFFLMKLIPGDPFDDEQALPAEVLKSLHQHYGLDRPLYEQYFTYLLSILKLDLGPSIKYRDLSVNKIIETSFPVSLALGVEALCLSLVLGLTCGSVAAARRGKWEDKLAMLMAVIGISVPSFILATLLQYLIAFKLGWLPIARWGTWAHTVLPALALAAMPTAFIARLTRSNMIEVLDQSYIRAAKARGLSTFHIVFKHALRNAILPVIAYMSQLTAKIFVGSFVVEKIFGIPGLGQWLVNAILNRDYTMIMGITVFYGILLLTVTFTIDILFGILDPRIRLTKGKRNAV